MALQLAAKGIDIAAWSAPKQTETTQRWKVQLTTRTGTGDLHTRLDFSRRGLSEAVAYGPVDPVVIRAYELPPVSATHYTREAAFWQKVSALADRAEPQARDVFDLDFLLRAGAVPNAPKEMREKVDRAVANAAAVEFDQFSGQVLPYLPEDQQAAYDKSAWQAAVLRVVEALERLS